MSSEKTDLLGPANKRMTESQATSTVFFNLRYRWNGKVIKAFEANYDYKSSVRLSSELLWEFCEQMQLLHSPVFVAFSGGKNSLVVLNLTRDALDELGLRELLRVIYIEVSGNTHEKNVLYVKKCAAAFDLEGNGQFIHLRKRGLDFWKAVSRWGFPGYRRRWCMNMFKRQPLKEFFSIIEGTPALVLGEKFEDSFRRKKTLTDRGVFEYNEYWGQYCVHPIMHWKRDYVHKYIEQNGLPINPLYGELNSSANCVYCFYITDLGYYGRLKERYPLWFDRIVEAEQNMRNRGSGLIDKGKKVWISDI